MLSLLLSSSPPIQPSTLPPNPLVATVVTKPAPIVSIQAFNAQLTIGGKDKALRSAAELFKNAAEKMEDSRVSGEKYWIDALKIRRGNWGLIPAPLPLGSATGKDADKTSRDFLISFGLEECKSSHISFVYEKQGSRTSTQPPQSSEGEPSGGYLPWAKGTRWNFQCANARGFVCPLLVLRRMAPAAQHTTG